MFFQAFIVSLLGIAAAAPPAGSIAPSHPGFRGSRVTKRDYNSGNWCGYVHSARSVTSVEATWVVPSIAAPPEGAGSGDYWSYQWVGIDGDKSSCNNLLQGGTGSLVGSAVFNHMVLFACNVNTVRSCRMVKSGLSPGTSSILPDLFTPTLQVSAKHFQTSLLHIEPRHDLIFTAKSMLATPFTPKSPLPAQPPVLCKAYNIPKFRESLRE